VRISSLRLISADAIAAIAAATAHVPACSRHRRTLSNGLIPFAIDCAIAGMQICTFSLFIARRAIPHARMIYLTAGLFPEIARPFRARHYDAHAPGLRRYSFERLAQSSSDASNNKTSSL